MKKNNNKKVRHVDSLIRTYPGRLPKDHCKEVIDYIDHMQKINVGNRREDTRTRDFQTNPSLHKGFMDAILEDRGVDPMVWNEVNIKAADVSRHILAVVNECLNEYATSLGINNQMPELQTQDVVIQKSNADTFDSYSRWHSEAGELSNCDRAMAWMIYLNDDFEGGETEFRYQKHREIPETGNVVLWPASFTHTHRGGMITDGIKYIATGWIHYSGNRSPHSYTHR